MDLSNEINDNNKKEELKKLVLCSVESLSSAISNTNSLDEYVYGVVDRNRNKTKEDKLERMDISGVNNYLDSIESGISRAEMLIGYQIIGNKMLMHDLDSLKGTLIIIKGCLPEKTPKNYVDLIPNLKLLHDSLIGVKEGIKIHFKDNDILTEEELYND